MDEDEQLLCFWENALKAGHCTGTNHGNNKLVRMYECFDGRWDFHCAAGVPQYDDHSCAQCAQCAQTEILTPLRWDLSTGYVPHSAALFQAGEALLLEHPVLSLKVAQALA